MAQKAQANEAYLEEFNRLEVELKQLQHELSDKVNLNDELTKVIAQKEEELITKDRRLESLRDRNIADGEQLELELLTLSEKYQFEVSTKEEYVRKLEIQYKRYSEIERENDALRETVDRLQALMDSNRDEHAIKMHEKNLEMKLLREMMEKKMRDQLNKMDISYQKDAFAALSERHKKAMFQNAKLKDEVALQGVGLNNLGSRLGKQNQQHDVCHKQLMSLNKRLRGLKERLAIIAAKKIEISRKKEEVLADEAKLQTKRATLRSRLDTEPRTPACAATREQLHTAILNTRCDVVMWTQRLALLQDLNTNLKPVYEYELAGRFNPKTFPLEASVSLHSSIRQSHHNSNSQSRGRRSSAASINSRGDDFSQTSQGSRSPSPIRSVSPSQRFPGIAASADVLPSSPGSTSSASYSINTPSTTSHMHANQRNVGNNNNPHHHYDPHRLIPMMVKPAEIEDMIDRDPSLAAALAPLRGKEAQLLVTLPGETPKKQKQGGAGGERGSVGGAGDQPQQEAVVRDQNMIAWTTLKIVDIWESTRQDTERLKIEKHALLERMLDALHSEGAMGSFYSDSSKVLHGAHGSVGSASHAVEGEGAGSPGALHALHGPPRNAHAPLHVSTSFNEDSEGEGEYDEDRDLQLADITPRSGLQTVKELGSRDERDQSGSDRILSVTSSANIAQKIRFQPAHGAPRDDHAMQQQKQRQQQLDQQQVEQQQQLEREQEQQQRAETMSLLSDTAKSIEGISALTSAYPSAPTLVDLDPSDPQRPPEHHHHVNVPALPLTTTAGAGAGVAGIGVSDGSVFHIGDSTPGTPRQARQAERDWIENGELDADALHQLWDEAFEHSAHHSVFASSTQPSYDGHHHHAHSPGHPEKGVTSWLKRVAPAKRYPATTEHMEGVITKTSHALKKTSNYKSAKHKANDAGSRPQTSDTNQDAPPSLTRNLTTELLIKDIKPVDASAAYLVGPPVLMHDKTSDAARESIQEMRRSLTLPQIASASRIDKSEHSPGEFALISEMPTGLEVTEDGLVLKDPLLAKKFAAQRKALVANATKAAAALRRATNELHRGKSAAALTTPAAGQRDNTINSAVGGLTLAAGAAPGNSASLKVMLAQRGVSVRSMSSHVIGESSASMRK